MFKYKIWRRWMVLFCGVILVVGFALSPGPVFGKDIKVLRIGIGIDPDTLNPFEGTTAICFNISELISDTLGKFTPDGKLEPNLATEWSVSEDGKTYTYKLRKGVRFTDGAPLTSETFRRMVELIQDPKVRMPFRFLFSSIEKVTVIDDYTFQFNLKAPFAPFAQLMAVYPPSSQKATTPYDANKLRKNPVGAGPYKLAEWVRGERVVLVRNENYWGLKPTVEKIIYRIIPETATRVAMLRAGQLEVAYSPSPPDIQALEADPKIKVVRPASSRAIFVAMNCQKGFTKDKRVRQALNYAVNKEAIVKKVLFGTAQPLKGPMPPSMFGYTQMENQYTYNPAKAKALLKEANFPKDGVIKMITPTGRYTYDKQVAEAVQAFLQDIGVKVELRTYDWPTYVAMTRKPLEKSELELNLIGWGSPYFDADFFLLMRFSSFVHPPRGLNETFYHNPEFDKAVGMARQIIDPAKRMALYTKASKIIWDEAPVIWLYVEPYSIAYRSNLKGFKILPIERFYPTYATMD